jgi:nucleoside-diphosphate-sugar epimerase
MIWKTASLEDEKMSLYQSKTYISDLEYTIKHTPYMKDLDGSSILVTGASGLICSGLIDLLIMNNEEFNGNTKIYAAGRSETKMRNRFGKYFERDYFSFVSYDASQENVFDFEADYIVHGASNAYPKVIWEHPIETMLDNFCGTYELLHYAESAGCKNVIFISSSEVYGNKSTSEPFREDEYGFLDILNPRSSYSSSKRAAETLCASFSFERGVKSVIIRPGHIYGPTALRTDNRVSSDFAYRVANGQDILMKSDGSQIRSYCYVLDAATSILCVMLRGKSGEAYNISNSDSVMSIRELAELYAMYGKTRLRFERPSEKEQAAFNPMVNSSLNSEKIVSLGWNGLFDSKTGTEHTILSLRESIF